MRFIDGVMGFIFGIATAALILAVFTLGAAMWQMEGGPYFIVFFLLCGIGGVILQMRIHRFSG